MDVEALTFFHDRRCAQGAAGNCSSRKAARVTIVTRGLSHRSGTSVAVHHCSLQRYAHEGETVECPEEGRHPPLVARAGAACCRQEHICSEGQEKKNVPRAGHHS